MHNAPSVTYPVGRCAVQGWVVLMLGGWGLLVLAWCWAVTPTGWVWGGALFWLLWAGMALRIWLRSATGRLQWDARAVSVTASPGARAGGWWWHGTEERGSPMEIERLEWVLDAQSVALLRLYPRGQRSRWVWLEAGRDPVRWDDLRRALSAHA